MISVTFVTFENLQKTGRFLVLFWRLFKLLGNLWYLVNKYERNLVENKIAGLYPNNEIIRAYAGHYTLAQFTEVAINKSKVFTRRGANIWDIIQAAYLIQKAGGEVFYENGENIFPINFDVLEYKDCHLIMPFTIACSLENKEKIIKTIK